MLLLLLLSLLVVLFSSCILIIRARGMRLLLLLLLLLVLTAVTMGLEAGEPEVLAVVVERVVEMLADIVGLEVEIIRGAVVVLAAAAPLRGGVQAAVAGEAGRMEAWALLLCFALAFGGREVRRKRHRVEQGEQSSLLIDSLPLLLPAPLPPLPTPPILPLLRTPLLLLLQEQQKLFRLQSLSSALPKNRVSSSWACSCNVS